MGETGPCGRCSEIYFFRGLDVPCDEPVCRGLECSCDRYVEIWNNVFMEFDRSADGTLAPLPALSVDTGMGLERATSVIQGTLATYDTDLFTPILSAIGERAGRAYSGDPGGGDHPDVSMRVIADHLRAMTFLIADGVLPSNEWRGYVLRKIMRRAMRHGKKLGIGKPFLHQLVDVVVGEMGGAYPELRTGRDAIVRTVLSEEDRFDAVLTAGLPRLEDLLDRTASTGATTVSGAEVFRLYDSLGVPFDFAEDLAGQRGLAVDRAEFDRAMESHRARARAGSKFRLPDRLITPETDGRSLDALQEEFVGYDRTAIDDASIAFLYRIEGDRLLSEERLTRGQSGAVVLDRTPFYVESGGQISDVGELRGAAGTARVDDVKRYPRLPRLHLVTVETGEIRQGDRVEAVVDPTARAATRRNHTATHLLHAALRQRLGSHVRQAGSLVAPDRLRFDFTHFQSLTDDERRDVERVVNEQVYRNTPVVTDVKSTEQAIQEGAMALFGEKYGDRVRVVSIEAFSKELCGGTHVSATGDIGPFVITEESGVAAGVRRIEAFTGAGAVEYVQTREAMLEQTIGALGVPAGQAADAIARLQSDARRLARENEQLKMKIALGGGGAGNADDGVVAIGDAKLVTRRVSGLEKAALRGLADSLRDRIQRGVVVVAAEQDQKVQLLVSVTRDLTERVKAGQLVKELAPIVGGGGGGRPDFAEAGGRDASRIDEMLAKARELVTAALG
jgi:alanyl-tRNA synthetase